MIRGPEPGDGATVVAGPSVCLFLSGSIGGNLTLGAQQGFVLCLLKCD